MTYIVKNARYASALGSPFKKLRDARAMHAGLPYPSAAEIVRDDGKIMKRAEASVHRDRVDYDPEA